MSEDVRINDLLASGARNARLIVRDVRHLDGHTRAARTLLTNVMDYLCGLWPVYPTLITRMHCTGSEQWRADFRRYYGHEIEY